MYAVAKTPRKSALKPRVLVVDDEPQFLEMFRDVVERRVSCRLLAARSVQEASSIIEQENIQLLVADLHLPDGKGTDLLAALHEHAPHAEAIVVSGDPTLEGALQCIRRGAADFLVKPIDAESLVNRVSQALANQARHAKDARRLVRLRSAVRRLNDARKTVSRKVDLLCNDLVNAYGDLSRQLDGVRLEENFRKTLDEAGDLEQMLCHAMDWILRQIGYSNVAIFLAADDDEYQLGAYMKYTIPSDKRLMDAVRAGLVPAIQTDQTLMLKPEELEANLNDIELEHLQGQCIMGTSCNYLGETLAVVVMYRDEKSPFTDVDMAALQAIAPTFAVLMASMVRRSGEGSQQGGADTPGDSSDPTDTNDLGDADWWKRGDESPY